MSEQMTPKQRAETIMVGWYGDDVRLSDSYGHQLIPAITSAIDAAIASARAEWQAAEAGLRAERDAALRRGDAQMMRCDAIRRETDATIAGLRAEVRRLNDERSEALTERQIIYNDTAKRGRVNGETVAAFVDRISATPPAPSPSALEREAGRASYQCWVEDGRRDVEWYLSPPQDDDPTPVVDSVIARIKAFRALDAAKPAAGEALEAAVRLIQDLPASSNSRQTAEALHRAGLLHSPGVRG